MPGVDGRQGFLRSAGEMSEGQRGREPANPKGPTQERSMPGGVRQLGNETIRPLSLSERGRGAKRTQEYARGDAAGDHHPQNPAQPAHPCKSHLTLLIHMY